MHKVDLSHTTRARHPEFPDLCVTLSLSIPHIWPHTMPFSPNTDATEQCISMDSDSDSYSFPPG